MKENEKAEQRNFLSKKLGVHVTDVYHYKGEEFITVSLSGLRNGYSNDQTADLGFNGELLTKLHNTGWKNKGISLVYGYYDEVDDLLLKLSRPINQENND